MYIVTDEIRLIHQLQYSGLGLKDRMSLQPSSIPRSPRSPSRFIDHGDKYAQCQPKLVSAFS